jgi:hypothetical protein
MSIIFRLSGTGEYNQPNAKSPYSDEVDAYFGPFRDHRVVQMARELRASRGVGYDAPMSLALHITRSKKLKEKISFDDSPPRLDKRWRPDEAREFLKHARDFVKKTKFGEFVKSHKKLYKVAGTRMTDALNKRDYREWFDEYFGARPGAKFHAIISLLNGPCNYGMGVRYPDGREEICPVLGVTEWDDSDLPVIEDSFYQTVVHEFCHSYTNAIVDRHAEDLEAAGSRLFSQCAETMKQQAYSNWKTMMYESMVRVCVVRYIYATEGKAAAKAEIKRQHGRGFIWTGDLSKLLKKYESDRKRYKTLDDFMPKVIAFFNGYEGRQKSAAGKAPTVVSMTPANGANDVDPNLTEITVVFDRPMKDGHWSVVGGGPHFPEITGQVRYDKARKVFTMPVRLKPNWTYQFWLNRLEHKAFQSEEGVPLESVAVTFTTRAE